MNIKLNFGDTHSQVVELNPEYLSDEIIQQAIMHWSLPVDQNYNLINVTKQKVIPPSAPLSISNIQDGDVLQITPIIVAG